MSRTGTCTTGCTERKLLLARASSVDALADAESELLASIAALSEVVAELATDEAPAGGWQAGYDALRSRARDALAHSPDGRTSAYVLEQPAEPVVGWWCDRCGGLDAPQPCLGICVWRGVEWAGYATYADLRERALAACEMERQLRVLVSRIVHTRPRPGGHRETWNAYREQAAKVLGSAAHSVETTQPAPRNYVLSTGGQTTAERVPHPDSASAPGGHH